MGTSKTVTPLKVVPIKRHSQETKEELEERLKKGDRRNAELVVKDLCEGRKVSVFELVRAVTIFTHIGESVYSNVKFQDQLGYVRQALDAYIKSPEQVKLREKEIEKRANSGRMFWVRDEGIEYHGL